MKGWVLSIIGVVLLIVLGDLILPNGRTRQVIRGAFSMLLILVILRPLPALGDFDWDLGTELSPNDSLLESLNERKIAAMQADGERYLAQLGYRNCRITLYGEWRSGVFVPISAIVLCTDSRTEGVRKAAAEYYGIESEKVVTEYG